MRFIQNLVKSYYRSKGFEIAFRKYKVVKGKYPQSIIIPRSTYAPWTTDNKFLSILELVNDHTLVDNYRCFELWQLAEEVASLEGDYLEVGVWRGGTGVIIAKKAAEVSPSSKVYLCDTFEGVVKASEKDNTYVSGEHADTTVEIVEDLVKKASLTNTEVLKGIFPDDTANVVEGRKFKMCHIDVDVYEGAKMVTEWIWDKLAVGGVIVYDDYGFAGTQGVTTYVEEVRNKKDNLVFHNLNGHAVIVKIS